MKQVYTRPFNPKNAKEKKKFVQWLYEQRNLNNFEPDLLEKDQARIYTIFDETGILGFVDVSVALFMNHVAFQPGLVDTRKAEVLKSFQHFIVGKAMEQNVPFAFFKPSDEHYAGFARRYGWNDVKDRLMKLRFSDLEGKDAEGEPS